MRSAVLLLEEIVIELEREYLGAVMEAGYIYLGMRRYREAREVFEGLCALAPGSELPHVALGNVDFCQGKVVRAISHYKKALKADPTSAFAKVYLGEALYFSGQKKRAVELLNEVASADSGGAGDFARALLAAIDSGFDPDRVKRVGVDNKEG
jgi:predicted Zn-dependent protease